MWKITLILVCISKTIEPYATYSGTFKAPANKYLKIHLNLVQKIILTLQL